MKVTKYNPDNILGWSEEDFEEVIYDHCQCRMANNIPLTPLMACTYLSTCEDVHLRRLGFDKETLGKERIKELEKEIERLKSER